MRFQLDINLTEEDYLAFNIFHLTKSPDGKKQFRYLRILLTAIFVVAMVGVYIQYGWTLTTAIDIIAFGLLAALFHIFLKKYMIWRTKSHLKKMLKTGNLPYDPVTKFEFYEDKLVEITAASRTEQNYTAMERICIVGDSYILFYRTVLSAYIFPIPQITAQLNKEEFLNFLSQKCSTVEHYK